LKNREAVVEGERRTVQADLGPVKFLATLLGQADEVVLRWFILIVEPYRCSWQRRGQERKRDGATRA
jgi:hypothetical protein